MKIDIWTDVTCPYCYVGKRQIEAVIGELDVQEEVEVEWKTFHLIPSQELDSGLDSYDSLAQHKGRSREWSVTMHDKMVEIARHYGLDLRFAKVRVTNSFDALRMVQLAKQHGLGEAMEERLFRAYFTEGELISDHDTLVRLATEVGLDAEETGVALQTNQYAAEVNLDMQDARRLDILALPFFLFNRHYVIMGAHELELFRETLKEALEDFKNKQTQEHEYRITNKRK